MIKMQKIGASLQGGISMKISEYFKTVKGTGALATADSTGRVDIAVYANPHVMDEETIVFIMTDRLTHQNLQSNPHGLISLWKKKKKNSRGKDFI